MPAVLVVPTVVAGESYSGARSRTGAEDAHMYKIDVKRQVEEMERVLRMQDDPARCQATISILRRWQFDEMLDDASREQARMLVLEFESSLAEAHAGALAMHWSGNALPNGLPAKKR
jgi:hypothetical protein